MRAKTRRFLGKLSRFLPLSPRWYLKFEGNVFVLGGGGGGGMLVNFYSISPNELNESSKNFAEFTHQIKKVFHFV